MNHQFCLHFITNDPDAEPLFHAHVEAPSMVEAMEFALRMAVDQNVCLASAAAADVQVLVPLPPVVLSALEQLRAGMHADAPMVQPASPHCH